MIIFGIFCRPYSLWHTFRIRPTRVPPIRNPLLRMPATVVAEMIRTQRLTSEQLISAYIERCREVNPLLNAIVDERFAEALDEARTVDRQIASGARTVDQMAAEQPLLGLPLTVKESIAVRGLSNQAGRLLPGGRTHCAATDAPSVALAKRAGAIVLLVSNTPELCMCWETYNARTGQTRNPYDLRRTPGGSSGGEAALLASGASLIGLCSDIAGSSRLPAAFCGVYGHKPTPFAVSPEGHIPRAHTPEWGNFFTVAPMTRYAGDLALLLRCIADPERQILRPGVGTSAPPQAAAVDVAKLRVFYMLDDGPSGATCPVDEDIRTAIADVAELLGGQRTHIDEFKWSLDISMSAMLRLPNVESIYFDKDADGRPVRTILGETLRYLCGRSDSTFPSVVVGHLQAILHALPEARHRQLARITERFKRRFLDLLGTDGVFVFPTFPGTAHRHYEIYHKLVEPTYMMVFNTLGLPVTNCMIRLDRSGLPIGVQVSANVLFFFFN